MILTRAPLAVEIALWLCPAEFRTEYREQIRADAAERENTLWAATDIACTGLVLRCEAVGRDLRYAVRTLRKSPLFTTVALLTLALAIGANVAVFGVIEATLLKPLPFVQPDRLVFLCAPESCQAQFRNWDIRAFQQQARTLQDVGAVQFSGATLTGFGTPRPLTVGFVSANFFDVLETKPEFGHFFVPSDAQPGVRDVVISFDVWKRYFNGDTRVVGKTMMLDRAAWRVIGVAPAKFVTPIPFGSPAEYPFDVWQALPADSFLRTGGNPMNDFAFARLAPGGSIAAAQADVERIASDLRTRYPIMDKGLAVQIAPFSSVYFSDLRRLLLLALAAVFAVLLIACANVTNLLLTRGVVRSGEFSVRHALGASRMRILSQSFCEVALLAAAAGVLGLALGWVGLRILAVAISARAPGLQIVGIDGRVVLFTFAIVVIVTVLAGVLPAMLSSRRELGSRLRSSGRSGDMSGGKSVRTGLAVAEIALAFAVIVVSGLLVRSFIATAYADPGYDTNHLYMAITSLGSSRYESLVARAAFSRAVLARV